MKYIRQAKSADAGRLAEIEVFNYRLNFYPIFQNDSFYFDELNVADETEQYLHSPALIRSTWVYDDGAVKGFVRVEGQQLCKLFVEPVLQGGGIGAKLLAHAVAHCGARWLWALEKNTRALAFYQRHGFVLTDERTLEEDTDEYLVRMERR